MSPRLKKARKVLEPPPIKGYKPYGPESGNQAGSPVYLLFEEYEALRLSDYDRLNHHKASLMMQVSRPTFTRIYASALRKIAKAFVEGRQIAIEGGKVYYDSDWYHCRACNCYFNNPDKGVDPGCCALCGSKKITRYDEEEPHISMSASCDVCVCVHCLHEEPHQHGLPCSQLLCPKCNHTMRRKRNT